MSMMDLLRKSLAFSVGAAAFSAEKLKQFADDMVARGEMTSDEARSFVDDMTKKADEERNKFQEWMREQASKVLQQAGAAEAGRVDMLEQRLAALERRVAELAVEVEEPLAGAKGGVAEAAAETGAAEEIVEPGSGGAESVIPPEGCG